MSWPVSWSSASLLFGSAADAVRSPVASGLAGFQNVYDDWANLTLIFFYSFTAIYSVAARLLLVLGQAEMDDPQPWLVPAMASVGVV